MVHGPLVHIYPFLPFALSLSYTHPTLTFPLPTIRKQQQTTYKHTYAGSRVIDTSPSHVLSIPLPASNFVFLPIPSRSITPSLAVLFPPCLLIPTSLCLVFYLFLACFPAIFPFSFSFQFRQLSPFLIPVFSPFFYSSPAPSSKVVQGVMIFVIMHSHMTAALGGMFYSKQGPATFTEKDAPSAHSPPSRSFGLSVDKTGV